jgi:hypothetical protein
MSHYLVASIIVLTIIVIPLIFVIMHNHQSKKGREKLLVFFSNMGAAYNLSFTGQEILYDKIIGLDEPRKKLLVVEENERKYDVCIINLYEVNSCKMKKNYTDMRRSDDKRDGLEDYLNSIALEFSFKNGKAPVAVSFYKIENHSVYQVPELEMKIKHWESTLSKILPARG